MRVPLLEFFLLVFVLSVPFALLGAVTRLQLMPGIPVSALGFVCPVTAASILMFRENGTPAVRALLRRAFDYARIREKGWYVPILLLMPTITVLTYALMRSMGLELRPPHFAIPGGLVLFLVFFVAALGEELGWTGYAIDPMQHPWGALGAAIILGVVWAAWHVVAMVQAGQSSAWIAWGCLDMVGTRILMVWIYNSTGKSVFAVTLYHAVANVSTKTLFPGGSYAAERIIALLIVATAALVVVVWGPQLHRRRQHPEPVRS